MIFQQCRLVEAENPCTKTDQGYVHGFYVIDFTADGVDGFSIVSADRRVDELLLFAKEGSIEDTTSNNGLKLFCDMIPNYLARKAAEFDVDSIYKALSLRFTSTKDWIDDGNIHYLYMYSGFIPDQDYEYMGEEWELTSVRGSGTILNTRWHQTYPYNDFFPIVPNRPYVALTGCVTISLAQIMAYHKLPYKMLRLMIGQIFRRQAILKIHC